MSKKANPITVGAFIVAGFILVITAVALFGSFRVFSRSERYILYFDTSVKGLAVGAPVAHRGVTIGSVADIRLRFNQPPESDYVPVIIEVREELLKGKSDRPGTWGSDAEFQRRLDRGLRGALKAESFVTGQLYVELMYVTNGPPPAFRQVKKIYREIPTVRTEVQALMENLGRLDLNRLTEKMTLLAERLDETIIALRPADLSRSATNVLLSLDRLLNSTDITNTLASARAALDEVRQTSAALRGDAATLSVGFTNTLADVRTSLTELRAGIRDLRDTLAPDAPLQRDLSLALDRVAAAASSVSDLAEFLTIHPDALLSGRQAPRTKQ